MAVVLVIVGIIISVITSVVPSLIQSAKVKESQETLEDMDRALRGFTLVQYRLPYADQTGDGTEDVGTFVGHIPYRTLGLFSGNDAWKNKVRYGVYEALTATTESDFCTTLRSITSYGDLSRTHITDQDTSQPTKPSSSSAGEPKTWTVTGRMMMGTVMSIVTTRTVSG